VQHHDLVREYEHPDVGRLRLMGLPLAFSDTAAEDPGPPPALGQHTDEVLSSLGYGPDAIADLRRRAVVR
jgi:crotonobetainyl-CoA:carnitine CoA-transferase CaiB-like acyl-CoA transferase